MTTLFPMKDSWQIQFEDLLEKKFQKIKMRNARFSLRAFAKMAQISPTLMSFILNRTPNWSLTLDRAIVCLEHLKIEKDKIDHFKVLATTKLHDDALLLSEIETGVFLTDPYYIPVLLSFGLTPQPSLELLADRFKMPLERIEKIKNELIRMGHLDISGETVVVATHSGKVKTQDGPTSEIIRQHHAGNIDLIRHSLMNDPTESRDVTSLTLTGDLSQIEEVKKEIRQFYQRVHAIMNHSDNKNEIFKIVVGFMPLNVQENRETL